jgi:hypothetical protein
MFSSLDLRNLMVCTVVEETEDYSDYQGHSSIKFTNIQSWIYHELAMCVRWFD